MKTIVVLKRRSDASADRLQALSRDETLAVWVGVKSGIVRSTYGLETGAGAVLELETSSLEEAESFIKRLPYVEENLLEVSCYPLKPFTAFEALFSQA